jgi:curved DNA-binding protein CbpA
LTTEDPARILDVLPGASDEEIRAAYLRKVKEYPPDRAPAEFERVRDAYETLRDPRRRTLDRLFSGDPLPRFETLLDACQPRRRFVGPKPWLAVLKEK